MIVKIEIVAGQQREAPTRKDIQKNIDALHRYIKGNQTYSDDILVLDTISILDCIKEQLP